MSRRPRRAHFRHGLKRATLLVAMLSCAAPAAMLTAPQQALAQSSGDIAKAQKHYEKGVEWYAAGDYPKAIVEFLKGHNLAPNAMFLYNISLCYEKMENYEEALKYSVRASGEQGFPAGYDTRNAGRIAAFRTIVEAKEAAPRIKRAAERMIVEHPPPDDPDCPDGADCQDKIVPPPADSGFGALGWTGVASAALGGAALVGMAMINNGLQPDIQKLEDGANGNPGWEGSQQDFNDLKDQVRGDQDNGKLLLYGGSGLAALGVVLIGIDLLSGGEESAASAVRIGPTDGGFAVSHGFRF